MGRAIRNDHSLGRNMEISFVRGSSISQPANVFCALILGACTAVYPIMNAEAQGIRRPQPSGMAYPRPSGLTLGRPTLEVSRSSGWLGDGARDHRYNDFWIGTIGVGAYGLLWFASCGGDSESCTRGELAWKVPVLAFGAGLVGALVGAWIPKAGSVGSAGR